MGRLASACGFEHVTLSHQQLRLPGFVLRGRTALVDAYVTGPVQRWGRASVLACSPRLASAYYVHRADTWQHRRLSGADSFIKRFRGSFDDGISDVKVEFMLPHGGLGTEANVTGAGALVCGASAGVVGCVVTAARGGESC